MLRLTLLYVILLQSLTAFSQLSLNSEVNVEEYPVISFELNHPGFNYKKGFSVAQLVNSEEQDAIINLIENVPIADDEIPKNKCVLILMEYSHHDDKIEQTNTVANAINSTISEIVKSGDEFKICLFSLTNPNGNILYELNKDYTDNVDELLISDIPEENAFNNSKSTNIYAALSSAIIDLSELDSNSPKSILLLSDERSNAYELNKSNEISLKAREKGIVIDMIKYNRQNYFQYSLKNIAENTYGTYIRLDKSAGTLDRNIKKESELISHVNEIINSQPIRSKGSNFRIELLLPDSMLDGGLKTIKISCLDSVTENFEISFPGKGNYLRLQLQKRFIETILFLVISFILLLFITYKTIRKIRLVKQKKIEKEKQALDDRVRSNRKLEEQSRELSRIKDQQKAKEKKEELYRLDLEKDQLQERLVKEMMNEGQPAFLTYNLNNSDISLIIDNPVFKIGRSSINNAQLNFDGVSRVHCEIIFKNGEYIIRDLDSTNGVAINGNRISEHRLENGDAIQLGAIVLSFYN